MKDSLQPSQQPIPQGSNQPSRTQQDKKLEKSFKCEYPECNYQSSRMDQLRIHRRRHTGEYFTCDYPVCDYKSLTSGNLKLHKRSHTGEYFYCSFKGCDYKSTTAGNLKVHLNRHNGVKSFVCTHHGCKYQATTNGNLKRHMKRHTGEKPFKCPFKNCNHQATRADNLKVHIRIHKNQGIDKKIKCSSKQVSSSISSTAKTKKKIVPKMEEISKSTESFPSMPSQHVVEPNPVNTNSTVSEMVAHPSSMMLSAPSMLPIPPQFNYPYPNGIGMPYGYNKRYPDYMYPPQFTVPEMSLFTPYNSFSCMNSHMYSYNLMQQHTSAMQQHNYRFGNVTNSILNMTASTLPGSNNYASSTTTSGSSPISTGSSGSTNSDNETSYQITGNQEIKVTTDKKNDLKCPFPRCTYKATTNANLKRHIRRHTGEKPFGCKVNGCDYRSAQAGNLKSHLKNRHPKEFQAIYAGKCLKKTLESEKDAAYMLMSMFSSSSCSSSSSSSASDCESISSVTSPSTATLKEVKK
jgi:uncharacterized Zn-finger protein